MNARRPILLSWFAVYAVLIVVGCRFGIQPLIVFAGLLVICVPPLAMHVLACRRVIRRTRLQHPDFWAKISSGLGMDLRYYLFDGETFGDKELLEAKAELKWWLRAGVIAMALFFPTLYVIHVASK